MVLFWRDFKFWCVVVQLELLGQSVYEFVHPCDQEELRDILTTRPGDKRFLAQRIFTVNWIVLWSLMCYWTCLRLTRRIFHPQVFQRKRPRSWQNIIFSFGWRAHSPTQEEQLISSLQTGRYINCEYYVFNELKTVNDPNHIQTHKIATLQCVSTCTAHQFFFY